MMLDLENMPWRITNDGVMGGLSQSSATVANGSLCFEGVLSLENNGGFASMLGRMKTPLHRFHGVMLTVTGDGRHYQLRLREKTDSNPVAWRAVFEAGATPRRLTLLPGSFEPVIRGEKVIGARPLAETPINHLGFMLVRGEPGPFHLEVRDIKFIHHATEDNRTIQSGRN